MRRYILCMSLLIGSLEALAQQNNSSDYTTAIGLKVYPGAISAKHFLTSDRAIEGLGFVSQDGFRLTGLYELHYGLGNVDGLNWYLGGGAHAGVWSDTWKSQFPQRNAGATLGVDGVIGIDYKIKGAPLNISFDWQPSFNFIGYNYFEGAWGGLGIRYTL